MGLFKPIWMTDKRTKRDKAIEAVTKETNPDKLKEIALNAPLREVAHAAVERVSDQAILIDIARQTSSTSVGEKVIQAIVDEQALFNLAMPGGALSKKVQAAAISKVRDRDMLLQFMEAHREDFRLRHETGHRMLGEAVQFAYARIERPTFEWSMLVNSKASDENLLQDVKEMSYPEDREALCLVARKKDNDAAALAVSMFPYETDAKFLRHVALVGFNTARLAALKKLRAPEDSDLAKRVWENHLLDLEVRKQALKLVQDDDPLLDTPNCCPYCGGVGTVHRNTYYSGGADTYFHGYECSECKKSGYIPMWAGDPKDFGVTLRELRDL